ncbi:16S rRNA (cytosine(1402)-N(4))-methyltransferase RsmH [Helicobacter muridarum]|nr:16S rRNA (cytosine(1402)-N(4))-methyltransferase RsmH [Helicobacter muridarum]
MERLSNIANISKTANILKSDETINGKDSKNLIESSHLPNKNKLNLIKSKSSQTNINSSKDLNRDFKIHIPVLLQEVVSTFDKILSTTESKEKIDNLNIKHNNQDIQIHNFIRECKQCIIDCTLGFGGMSKTLLENYDNLSIIGIDRDTEAIKANKTLNKNFPNRLHIHWGDFASALPQILQICECYPCKLKGVLVDMGVSSYQLDCTSRGFNFKAQNLDMRMDSTQKLHATQILHSYNNYELQRIFRDYGEIPYYKKLARLIIEERQKGAITGEILQNIALKISNKKKIHPATLIYQALRIEVNDELGQLARLLESCSKIHNAIVCFISFHSLEDKMIKESMRKWAKSCICEDNKMKCECGNNNSKGKIIYKKPITATNEELRHNPRARSAKLRAFHFL